MSLPLNGNDTVAPPTSSTREYNETMETVGGRAMASGKLAGFVSCAVGSVCHSDRYGKLAGHWTTADREDSDSKTKTRTKSFLSNYMTLCPRVNPISLRPTPFRGDR